jgi:uncharacterized hydrophobic protein (TIGR00271 family)
MGIRERIQELLGIPAEAKPKVYVQVYESAEFASLNYGMELLLSAGIATLGLVLNSPAVVIGAMLVSPLMGPILAAGLALAASDVYLGIKCVINLALSVVSAVLFSALLVWFLPFHSPTAEILARTQPNLLDLGVALFSGLAGSLVVCRGGGGGGVTALPGVAIAVALMPPLCTVGYGVGSGMDWAIISGAGLLFVTNLAAIIACAFLVFVAVRMDAPDVRMKISYSELEHASHDRLYAALRNTRLGRLTGEVGQFRLRVLMLALTLAVLFVPLRQALLQLRDETVARGAVREALRLLGPADAFLTQELDILADRIVVRVVAVAEISREKLDQAERLVSQRTGKSSTFTLRQVASQEEIALLKERLRPPPPPPPAPQDLESIRKDLVARLGGPLKQVWPEEAAPLTGFEIGLSEEGAVARIRYESRRPLEASTQEMLTRHLRAALKNETLRVELEQELPKRSPPRKG